MPRGDIISIDVGVTLDGWVADAARTFPVEEVSEQARNLLERPSARCSPAWRPAVRASRMGDVSSAIQEVAEEAGLSVVRSLVGHGVGRSMHEDPQVPNYGRPGKGPLLEEGMVLAIEPMTTAGRPAIRVGGDSWAIYAQDGSPAAHFEFTVAITGDGPRVLDAVAPAARAARGASARRGARGRRLRAPRARPAPVVTKLLPSGVLPECVAFRLPEGNLHDTVAAAATAARAESPEHERRKGS